MKKVLALVLTLAMVFCFTATFTGCGSEGGSDDGLKIGLIMVGDENEGYTYAHMEGIRAAAATCGIDESQLSWKYSVGEDETCADAAADLADQGCTAIFSNSYGHQAYMQDTASKYPDVTFVACTGDTAAVSGLDNFKNAFTGVYQSRYVAGVVAGMKIAEQDEAGKIPDKCKTDDGKVKLGYVGAYPYAEVVSGYTAYFLGVQSIYPDVVMDVQYTNSWFDITAEGEAANALMNRGCFVIAQHADSTGAPAAVQAAFEKGENVYSVGYNVDMLSVAPDVALTSAANNWEVYYTYAFNCLLNGEDIDVDKVFGYEDDGVHITDLGEACAEGTQEKVDETIAGIKDGSVKVFNVDNFTVGGDKVSTFTFDSSIIDFATGDVVLQGQEYEAIEDGQFVESKFRSAPYFSLRIDGITELNAE